MKSLYISLIFIIFLTVNNVGYTHVKDNYWTISEFQTLHPLQQKLSDTFSAIVREVAVPIEKKNKKIKIFIVYPGEQISDYWRRSVQSLEARLKELAIDYELKAHYTKAVVATLQQKRLLERSARFKPDYLIFTLDVNEHKLFIERIMQQASAPKLILQNITTPLKAWSDKQPFLYVGFDHIQGSELLARYYQANFKKSAHYAMMYWAPGYISDVRGDSFIGMLKASKHLSLSSSNYTEGTRASAYFYAKKAIELDSNLSFIYACSTDVALGVSEAIRDMGMFGKITVNGWGGGESELKAIEQGVLDVTVMRMNDDNGVAMAEAIKLDILGQSASIPLIYSGDFKIVDKKTSPKLLTAYKNRAFRYSGLAVNL